MRIVVDRTRCTGTGICEATEPAVFEIDENGVLTVLVEQVSANELDAVGTAVRGCPTQALSLIEA